MLPIFELDLDIKLGHLCTKFGDPTLKTAQAIALTECDWLTDQRTKGNSNTPNFVSDGIGIKHIAEVYRLNILS